VLVRPEGTSCGKKTYSMHIKKSLIKYSAQVHSKDKAKDLVAKDELHKVE
jgi:hypothetical protein